MLHFIIEKVSNHPGLFLFCRGVFEANFRAIRRTIHEQLPARADRRVLDVACGPGAFSELFPADGYVGVDMNERYIRYAQRHYPGTFRVMDARKLDFEDDTFDDVLVYGLLHHLNDADARAVLAGISRVLKPGGRVLIIEDIPTESRLNLVGHLLHHIENGHFIRAAQEYRDLLKGYLHRQDEQFFRSGFCDYYMASLTAQQATAPAATAARAQQAT
jgi:ubiquinone/menaquinone biosynthesis C-methylase UbiE